MHELPPPERLRMMQLGGCLAVALLLFSACLLPLVFLDLAKTALQNLYLSEPAALLVLLGMLLGSVINIPVARFPLDQTVEVPIFEPVFGWGMVPRMVRLRQEMVVAVNVGGCVIPVLLAIWLLRFILAGGPSVVVVLIAGIAANTYLCYRLARPIPRLGIALPPMVPVFVSLFVIAFGLVDPEHRPLYAPVAFVIGITGPLLGADLLHWRDFRRIGSGVVSIGGAGTWDGIVLAGLMSALLAGLL